MKKVIAFILCLILLSGVLGNRSVGAPAGLPASKTVLEYSQAVREDIQSRSNSISALATADYSGKGYEMVEFVSDCEMFPGTVGQPSTVVESPAAPFYCVPENEVK